MDYQEFLESKRIITLAHGMDISADQIQMDTPCLFDYQRDIVRWALAKGRSAIFAGTGMGKTRMQLAWSRYIGNVLILAPLAVAEQTVEEGKTIGLSVNLCSTASDVRPGINITNYEKMDKFDMSVFDGIVLDESSILKSQTGKVRTELIRRCECIPYRLCCTATPSPNDYMELGNHSEFLGVMKSKEMLATFFVHDGGETSKWRLKKHALMDFWDWVASWAVMLTNPSDLGYDGTQFILPPLSIKQITVQQYDELGIPIDTVAKTLTERHNARRDSMDSRVDACVDLLKDSDESWLIWCNLNAESDKLHKKIPGSVEVKGSDKPEYKAQMMRDFTDGKVRILLSKPSICGFGMNWQHCHNMAFVGLSDSFEQYYQAVRRCYRFGQLHPVNVYFIVANTEGAVVANIKRKENDFDAMLHHMIAATQDITANNIRRVERQQERYNPKMPMVLPLWLKGEVS